MIQQIENSKVFNTMSPIQRAIVIKKANRDQIQEAVITARAIGFETWKKNSTFSAHWNNLVKELI